MFHQVINLIDYPYHWIKYFQFLHKLHRIPYYNLEDRKSNSAFVFKYNNCTISWNIAKQKIVSLSFTECSYIELIIILAILYSHYMEVVNSQYICKLNLIQKLENMYIIILRRKLNFLLN